MNIRGEHWSQVEVEAAVADYMHMLALEFAGQQYNKTAHRRALIQKLNNRSESSVERKHQNISAVLRDLGCHWISGYKPLPNYQANLFQTVETWLQRDTEFDALACAAAEQPAVKPLHPDLSALLVDPPKNRNLAEEPRANYNARVPTVGKRDYVAREARNTSLGLAGEELIVEFERFRLSRAGHNHLANRVEHISQTRGDGAGFDVLSFDITGRERFIEVKTTAFSSETPFFASRHELEFARKHETQFSVYRVFNFRRTPKFFQLLGRVESHCALDPVTYLCRL